VVEEMTDSEDYTDKTSRVWQDALGRDIRFVYNDDDDVAVNYTKKMNPINWVYQVVDMKQLDDYTSNSEVEDPYAVVVIEDNVPASGQGDNKKPPLPPAQAGQLSGNGPINNILNAI
jgi:hypothetical protein